MKPRGRPKSAETKPQVPFAEKLVKMKENDAKRKAAAEPKVRLPRVKRWSPGETREQMKTVESLVTQLASKTAIYDICRERHQIGMVRVNKLIERIYAMWQEEDKYSRASWKSAAIRRIQRWLTISQGQQDASGKWIVKPDSPSIAKFETILADLQGTREPIKVDLDMRASQACINVIAGLSAEQVAGMVSKYKENVELAARYRDMQNKSLPANGVTVKEKAS